MMWSSREVFDLVAPRAPEVCLDAAALSNVRDLTAQLPAIFSSYYLECRLAQDQSQVDFLACISSPGDPEGARRVSAAARQLPPGRSCDPTWQLVRDAICRWASPEEGWYRRIPYLWLEFDHVGTRSAAQQAPSFCICTDPTYPRESPQEAPWSHQEAYEGCCSFLRAVISPASEGLLSTPNMHSTMECFARLPPGGRIIHVSFMVARDPMTIKLYGVLPRDRFTSYLNDIGWPGPAEPLERMVDSLCTADVVGDKIYFDLAIDGAILPYAAVAFSQLQLARSAASGAGHGTLLQLLVEQGLCTSGKREALAAWSGYSREVLPTGPTRARIQRWLDMKVSLAPERGIAAKGYLGFGPSLSIF